jgi:hypothetical protein
VTRTAAGSVGEKTAGLAVEALMKLIVQPEAGVTQILSAVRQAERASTS